jgi:elongation factor Ts
MAITAADVNKLRQMTGAGMMDCKKALTETDGDFDKAIEFIRKSGQAVANKRADREVTEGCVLAKVSADGKSGVLIALCCETDFVAKNEGFVKLTTSILEVAIANKPANVEALLALPFEGGITIGEKITEQIGVIGEKLEITCYEQIAAEQVTAYIHPGNKLATLVGFNQAGIDAQVGKDIAMQIAAMAPVSIDSSSVPESVKEKELEIARELARNEGKPENMLDKIAQGRLAKFFKESTLLEQEFVKNNKMTIKQYLESVSKGLTATAFKRFTLNQ